MPVASPQALDTLSTLPTYLKQSLLKIEAIDQNPQLITYSWASRSFRHSTLRVEFQTLLVLDNCSGFRGTRLACLKLGRFVLTHSRLWYYKPTGSSSAL